MNKPITGNKFASDLWSMTQMLVEEAVLAEREACAKLCKNRLEKAVLAEREACAAILDANAMACESPIMRSLLQSNAQAIRVRGQA
jgi:hypothetical protein